MFASQRAYRWFAPKSHVKPEFTFTPPFTGLFIPSSTTYSPVLGCDSKRFGGNSILRSMRPKKEQNEIFLQQPSL